jgi:hypothetical protein
MADWLADPAPSEVALAAPWLAARLVFALALGMIVAFTYRFSHGRGKPDAPVMATTLVLLTVLIAMVSMVIGNSVARAFSLVGALSIVRFRTVVDDTRDTAFVIFAVIVGMAVGVGQFLVPIIGIPVVSLAAAGLSLGERGRGTLPGASATLSLRLGLGHAPSQQLDAVLAKSADQMRIVATSTARQGAAIDISYQVQLKPGVEITAFVAELNQIEGILSVELKRE